MKIQLKAWNITDLNFSVFDEDSKRDKDSFDLETGNYFSEEEKDNIFGVGFKIKIKDRKFDLSIKAVFHFELIDEQITEKFKLSSFPKINAPAIAFPFLRAYISNFTLQSGFEPVILPSINFVRLSKEDDNSSSQEINN